MIVAKQNYIKKKNEKELNLEHKCGRTRSKIEKKTVRELDPDHKEMIVEEQDLIQNNEEGVVVMLDIENDNRERAKS